MNKRIRLRMCANVCKGEDGDHILNLPKEECEAYQQNSCSWPRKHDRTNFISNFVLKFSPKNIQTALTHNICGMDLHQEQSVAVSNYNVCGLSGKSKLRLRGGGL